VKVCEHLDPALRALHHEEATPEIFQQIQNIKKNLTTLEENPQKRGAFR
jgi:hypothetical protein